MFDILTLNKISEAGTGLLPTDKYNVNSEINNPDAILLRSYVMHNMDLPKNLKAIGRAGAGVNNIPIQKCTENGIVVFNTPGANANAVKELVIAGLLLSSRKIVDGINWAKTLKGQVGVDKLVEKGKSEFAGSEISGKKIAVVGLGAIGVLVANACHSLGMEVVGYDPFISVDAAWRLSRGVKKATTIDEVLEDSDFITVHVPLMDATKELINKNSLAKCKDGIKILNFSRAELVNDTDIKEAIVSKKVSCYVTDFPNEDTIDVEGIIAIPHLGASTEESEENCAAMAAMEIKDYLEFGTIKNSVNFPDCELPFTSKKRICIINKNIPDVIGSLTKLISSKKINIENMLNKSKGEYSYTLLDVNVEDLNGIENDILKVEGVIRVRII